MRGVQGKGVGKLRAACQRTQEIEAVIVEVAGKGTSEREGMGGLLTERETGDSWVKEGSEREVRILRPSAGTLVWGRAEWGPLGLTMGGMGPLRLRMGGMEVSG